MTSIRVGAESGLDREALTAHLREARIDTRPVFTPISQYPFWPRRQAAQPVATAIGARGDQPAERRHAAPRAGRPGVRRDPPGGGSRLAESGVIRLGRPTYRPDPAVVARTPGSDVLVALSVKDGERFLPEAIECVLAQEGVDLRLEVYDNGSTDRSVEIARGYAARDPRVGVLVNPPGFNYFSSMNRAIAGSTAEFFCPWACDDVMDPDNLVQKVAALLEHPDAGFAWSPTLIVDDHGRVADFFPDVTQVEPYMAAPDFMDVLLPVGEVVMSSVVMRTSAIRQIGGFDPRTDAGRRLADLDANGHALRRRHHPLRARPLPAARGVRQLPGEGRADGRSRGRRCCARRSAIRCSPRGAARQGRCLHGPAAGQRMWALTRPRDPALLGRLRGVRRWPPRRSALCRRTRTCTAPSAG